MANPNKCSVCGYKFNDNDGSLCPECLTGRDKTINMDDEYNTRNNSNNTDESYTSNSTEIKREKSKFPYSPKKIRKPSAVGTVIFLIVTISSFLSRCNPNDSETNSTGIIFDDKQVYVQTAQEDNENNYNYIWDDNGFYNPYFDESSELEIYENEFAIYFGDTINDGEFEITLNAIENMGNTIENIKATEGNYYISVNVSVKNTNEQERLLYLPYVYIVMFSPDGSDVFPINEVFSSANQLPVSIDIQSQQTIEGNIIFEVSYDAEELDFYLPTLSGSDEEYIYNLILCGYPDMMQIKE